jgi:hypothetical protein
MRILQVMTTINLTDTAVLVRFARWEKLAGLVRDIDVPLGSVRAVELAPDGLAAASGLRAPGLGLPGRRKIGTWRRPGAKTLVSVRRGQPAVQIELQGARFDRLVIGADEAARLVERLRSAVAGNR